MAKNCTVIMVQPFNFPVGIVTKSQIEAYRKAGLRQHKECQECINVFLESMNDAEESVTTGGAITQAGWSTHDYNVMVFLPDEYHDLHVFHEALHVAINIYEMAGKIIDVSKPSREGGDEELLTYMQTHIVNLIRKHVYKMEAVK